MACQIVGPSLDECEVGVPGMDNGIYSRYEMCSLLVYDVLFKDFHVSLPFKDFQLVAWIIWWLALPNCTPRVRLFDKVFKYCVYTRKTCQLYLCSFIYSACSGQGLGLTDHMNWCLLGKVRSTLRPTLIPFFYSRINTTLCFHSTKFYMTMSIFLTSMRILTKNSAQNY